ncbi:6-phospho-3-hexuloisomerase [Marinococcus sp. PL1-022]|uniref:6-phospho-3-hexuloisomerase n=1 Tax=Marinococcus sp. PL1-022 TaxID=3095363 RepID=UPI0029C5CFAD|nr:6-phospho-3-hexuloisomerase [Marinococcus sp. PL1-022]MDX6154172.1 6-phospho-3-hexuloisomerase [Marinococcus sp. PL1-022]
MNTEQVLNTISREITEVVGSVNAEEAEQAAARLNRAPRIFVAGEGRSGLVGKMFAMRLMHSGYNVFVVGETITPSVSEGDLLVVLSGSGNTPILVHTAEQAKKSGAELLVCSTNRASSLGKISSAFIEIPAATKKRLEHEPETIQPLGNQFDQSLHLILDGLIIAAVHAGGNADYEQMARRHSNME